MISNSSLAPQGVGPEPSDSSAGTTQVPKCSWPIDFTTDPPDPTTPRPVSLRLPASAALPRKLVINWHPVSVAVHAYGPNVAVPLVAAAGALADAVTLREGKDGAADLLVGGTCFPLTPPEVELVKAAFCTRGLRVERG